MNCWLTAMDMHMMWTVANWNRMYKNTEGKKDHTKTVVPGQLKAAKCDGKREMNLCPEILPTVHR